MKESTANSNAKQGKGKNTYIVIASEYMGVSYEEAREYIRQVKEKYGFTAAQFVNLRCDLCKTEADFLRLIKEQQNRRQSLLNNICKMTGWSIEKAQEETKRIKDKFGLSLKLYYSLDLYKMNDEEIEDILAQRKAKREADMQKMMEESGWTEKRLNIHMRYARAKYGIDRMEFKVIKAWNYTRKELGELSCHRTTTKLFPRKYNQAGLQHILTNKLEFNQTFDDCLGRKYWTNDANATFESFCRFVDGLDYVMIKPLNLTQARGVEKIPVSDDKKAMYDEFMKRPTLLLEEVIQQHSDISKVYPYAVNTVRIVTLLKDDVCHFLCSFMRFGQGGSVIDNLHAGGIILGVNEETGIIETNGVDWNGIVYENHPDTGQKLMGFKIPHYDLAREITEKAIRRVPGINYVGWDVAICQDKAVIIEGNSQPGLMAYQLPYLQPPVHEPKYRKFEPFL